MGVFNFIAAQNPYTFQYLNNPYVLNPARAGFPENDEACNSRTFLSHKQFWEAIPNEHSLQILTTDIGFPKYNHGIGITAYQENVHIIKNMGVQFAYAYHINFDNSNTPQRLSIGIDGGFNNTSLDLSNANVRDMEDELLLGGDFNSSNLGFSFGFTYQLDDFFFDGASQFFIGKNINSQNTSSRSEQQYNLMASYNWEVSDVLTIKPILLSRFYGTGPIEIGGNIKFDVSPKSDAFQPWAAIGYRNQSLDGTNHMNFSLGGVITNRYHFGLNFDTGIDGYGAIAGNTFELQLGFLWGRVGETLRPVVDL